MRDEEVSVERNLYPNGAEYVTVFVGRENIGLISVVPQGYIPFGCRKAESKFRRAVERVIERRLQRVLGDAARLARALESGHIPDEPMKGK